MGIRITKDFLSSLSTLAKSEQKRTNETIFNIKNKNRGLRYHKIEHPSKSIFSYSVNKDIRLISHQNKKYLTILFVGHHDDAYNWINKRKFIDSKDQEISIITLNEEIEAREDYIVQDLQKIKTLKEDLINELKNISDDDEAIEFISNQSDDIQDELLEFLVSRSKSHYIVPNHYIKVINDDNELEQALKYPLEFWRVFLHPIQGNIIRKPINQSTFITGGPGTGKTVCLIHKIKLFEKELKSNECVILTTFKKGLMDYLERMLKLLKYDTSKTFIDDISQIKLHEGKIKSNAKFNGLFHIENETLNYYNNGKKYIVKHLLFDEYQDFRKTQVKTIKQLIKYASFTLSFDYSQAIYRNVNNTIEELDTNQNIELQKLDLSYRINSKILEKLKQIVRVIRVLSSENRLGNFALKELEEELIENANASIIGSPLFYESYENENELNEKISTDFISLKNVFENNEIVITSFFNDLYKNLTENESFHNEKVPKEVRSSYKYITTLKGKEFKAGIVILDDTICQLLNMNRSVFQGSVDTGYLGGAGNYRLNLNLLFVALSRFRDYLKVYYPKKYEIIIQPILG